MTAIKRVFSAFLCFIMMATVLSAFSLTASAATFGGSKATTITVTTKANYWYPGASSITLKQENQTLSYKKIMGTKTKTKTGYYGRYDISIYNVTKNKTTYNYWNGGKTKKISLDPNCTYRITVAYNSNATALYTKQPFAYSWMSTSSPRWQVSSTWKISSYR